jgi:hypothetical protein
MAGFFSSDNSYIFILFLIMIIMAAIVIKFLEINIDWRRAPIVMIIGFMTLSYLHPGWF